MVTKYICMAANCDFITEDTADAVEHRDTHDTGTGVHHMAIVTYSEDEGTSCETFY